MVFKWKVFIEKSTPRHLIRQTSIIVGLGVQHCTTALPEPLLKRFELPALRLILLPIVSTAETGGAWRGAGRQARVATAAEAAGLTAGTTAMSRGVPGAEVYPLGASHDRAQVIVRAYRPVTCRQNTI